MNQPLKQLTWNDFPNPCYDPQERYGDFNGTILDILNDVRIPDNDKIWAATCPNILDDKTLRLFACACVRQVWHLLTDDRSKNAVEVAERYANGQATDKELSAAWDAAWDAMRDAAWDAVRAAAWAAACDAMRDAAWGAARKKQIEILIKIIS